MDIDFCRSRNDERILDQIAADEAEEDAADELGLTVAQLRDQVDQYRAEAAIDAAEIAAYYAEQDMQ
jgi:hypothetical protein